MIHRHLITVALATIVVPASVGAQACSMTGGGAAAFIPEAADSGRIYSGIESADGTEFWFFKQVGEDIRAQDYRIMVSRRSETGWGEPEQLLLGEEASDLYPALSDDGRLLVFVSYRRSPGDTSSQPNASIWSSRRTEAGWTKPRPVMAAQRIGYYHSALRLDKEGVLHFRRLTPDYRNATQLRMRQTDAGWSEPTPDTESPFQSWADGIDSLHMWTARISPDGSGAVIEVAVIDAETGRRGPSDLWVSNRLDEGWSAPRPISGGVNLPGVTENFIWFSADGCRLGFTRDFSRWLTIPWSSVLEGVP